MRRKESLIKAFYLQIGIKYSVPRLLAFSWLRGCRFNASTSRKLESKSINHWVLPSDTPPNLSEMWYFACSEQLPNHLSSIPTTSLEEAAIFFVTSYFISPEHLPLCVIPESWISEKDRPNPRWPIRCCPWAPHSKLRGRTDIRSLLLGEGGAGTRQHEASARKLVRCKLHGGGCRARGKLQASAWREREK